MKFIVNREILLPVLVALNGVVPRNPQESILTHFLFRINVSQMEITASDKDIQITTTIDSFTNNETSEFGFTLPARKLTDIVRNISENSNINFEITDSRTIIRSGKSKFILSHMISDGFPLLLFRNDIQSVHIRLQQNELKNLMNHVHFCIASQDVRKYLNGLLIDIKNDSITTVATDGHRLACMTIPTAGGSEDSERINSTIQIILPRKSVTELLRLLNDSDKDVLLDVTESLTTISFDNTVFTSRLIDGRYPEYMPVIPSEQSGSTIIMDVPKEPLRHALIRTSILSNERYRGIRFMIENNVLSLSINNLEHEEAEDELTVEFSGSNRLEFGLNVSYVIDVLNTINDETVRFLFKDSDTSCRITPLTNENIRYVIMPMKI